MKKSRFVALVMGSFGFLLSVLGLCMCLTKSWHSAGAGLVMFLLGLLTLLAMMIVYRRMEGKPPIRLEKKGIQVLALSLTSVVALVAGACLTLLWGQLVTGVLVGIIGMVLLICIVPVCRGIR